jgi:hypothetical protein
VRRHVLAHQANADDHGVGIRLVVERFGHRGTAVVGRR